MGAGQVIAGRQIQMLALTYTGFIYLALIHIHKVIRKVSVSNAFIRFQHCFWGFNLIRDSAARGVNALLKHIILVLIIFRTSRPPAPVLV